MAKFRSIKTSLIAGEIGPRALGRIDIPQYNHGCEILQNMIPHLSGGAYRRPGTLFTDDLPQATDYAPRLIPFIFSKNEAYALLYGKVVGGANYIRGYRASDNVSAGTQAVVTGTHPYLFPFLSNSNTLGYEDEIHTVQYAQTGDVLKLVHPKRIPQKIIRTAINAFTASSFDSGLTGDALQNARPYRPQNTSAVTLRPNAVTGVGITIFAEIAAAPTAFFQPGHVGAYFKIQHPAGPLVGSAVITAVAVGGASATATVISDFSGTTAQPEWWESSWSDYRGWPRTITYFQHRLVYGGNIAEPDTIWFSRADNYDKMSEESVVDPRVNPIGAEAFEAVLSSTQLNQIQWMLSAQGLVIGTTGGEFVLDREANTATFGRDNAAATPQSQYGSAYHPAIRAGSEIMFQTSTEDEIRAYNYNYMDQGFSAETVQLLFDGYPKAARSIGVAGSRKIRDFTWDEARKTLWCIDTRGNLFGMTRDRKLQLSSWHEHQMGGYIADQFGAPIGTIPDETTDPAYYNNAGSVLSIITTPNPLNGGNDLWMVVKRYINGAIHFHVERMAGKDIPQESVIGTIVDYFHGGYFADSIVYNVNVPPPDYIFSGLGHLEGEVLVATVTNVNGMFTARGSAVSGGSTTMQAPHPPGMNHPAVVIFGLPFSSIVKPVRIEAGSQLGTAQGAVKRIHRATVRLFKTLSLKMGSSPDKLETIIFRKGSTPMGQSPDLFSGDILLQLTSDYDRDGYIYLLQDEPLPFTVLSIIAEGETFD